MLSCLLACSCTIPVTQTIRHHQHRRAMHWQHAHHALQHSLRIPAVSGFHRYRVRASAATEDHLCPGTVFVASPCRPGAALWIRSGTVAAAQEHAHLLWSSSCCKRAVWQSASQTGKPDRLGGQAGRGIVGLVARRQLRCFAVNFLTASATIHSRPQLCTDRRSIQPVK